jgi:hypothetical protein
MLEALIEDVRHVDMFLKLGDVQVVFGVSLLTFHLEVFFLFDCFSPLSGF